MKEQIATPEWKTRTLPADKILYQALFDRDTTFEGIFFAGVKTTGIFCRPTCTARKPLPENVEFFRTTEEAIIHGYRPCKVCHPLEDPRDPEWIRNLLKDIETNPGAKITDEDIRNRGLDPNRVRRWFKKNHGITFQSFARAMRIQNAFRQVRDGSQVIHSAYDSGYDSLSGFNETFKKLTGFPPIRSRSSEILISQKINTPLGPMMAVCSEQGLCLLEFTDRRMLETQIIRTRKIFGTEIVPGEHKYLQQTEEEIGEYFQGRRTTFEVSLDIRGTDFQLAVWSRLMEIQYGQTRSYLEQAKATGNSRAVRAVARANGDNRISIIIPCHRVIGSNGSLTGYGGGIWRKKYLLDLESGYSAGG